MARCAIYVRLSQDREGETSTERQEADCRKFAEAKGWELVHVYKDLQSAWRDDKERADFERMLEDAAAGKFDVLLVWKFDRLARSVLTFERAVRHLIGLGVQFASLAETVDTTTPMGKFMLHLTGSLAQLESDTISYRVKAASAHQARRGEKAWGGRRTFGYNRDGTVNEAEAALLRQAADRFLAGEALNAIVKDWNRRGIRTPGTKGEPEGKAWGASVLGRLLRRERIAGLRRHGDQVYRGTWEPILDEATFYRVAGMLDESKRRTVRRGVKRHLLTGIAQCGLCGTRLGSGAIARREGSGILYRCPNAPGRYGCGKVSIRAAGLEGLIERAVIRRMHELLAQGLIVRENGEGAIRRREEERRRDQDALEQLGRDYYVDHLIDRGTYMAARAALEEKLADHDEWIRRAREEHERGVVTVPEDPEQAWAEADLETRRRWVESFLGCIVIGPATPGVNRFDPNRITVVDRHGQEARIAEDGTLVLVAVTDESTPPLPSELPGTPESRDRARRALAGED